jgi:TonB family protein
MFVTLAALVLVSMSTAAQERQTVQKTSPVLTHEVHPDYTDAAKARKVQGAVEMAVVVKADGTVGDARVTKSLDPDLDQQALKAVRQWTFRAGTVDGTPVDVEVNVEMTFTLRDRPKSTEPAPSPIYKIGQDGVKAPILVKETKPKYTDEAKARGVQGAVELTAIVKADGTLDDNVRVTQSLDPDLDQEAIKAARQWQFRPGTKDGAPVPVEVKIELTFTLK